MKAFLYVLALATAAAPSLAVAGPAPSSPLYGRWSVSDDRPVFTVRGHLFKTIDIQPCGDDFCGVSVSDTGQCGASLFRFLGKHANNTDALIGHTQWGQAKKNIVIYVNPESEVGPDKLLEIYIGDGHDFGERSENMPKFHASYRRAGQALCRSR